MINFLKQIFITYITFTCLCLLIPYSGIAKEPGAEQTSKIVLISDVKWEPLNPARGDKGPKAGTLWGDFTKPGSSGFLVKFVDGFSSPPHIHNITYRGVVINGLIHNDDPNAPDRWMPQGSYWTQPKGEVHLTSAKGIGAMAYIEIDDGPYLVLPVKKAFDSKERTIKVDATSITWKTTFENGPKIAFPWDNPKNDQSKKTLVNLPSGFEGKIISKGPTFRVIVIKGKTKLRSIAEAKFKILKPGSYFSSKGELVYQVLCEAGKECIIYVGTDGKFDVIPAQ